MNFKSHGIFFIERNSLQRKGQAGNIYTPLDNFTEDNAALIIQKFKEHHESIMHTEWLNGRIGSKALFK
jgi:hypothetical protein